MPPRQLKLSDRHLRALGRINSDFQELEFVLIGALGNTLGDEAVGYIIASYLSFGVITALFEALFRHKYAGFPEQIETLSALIHRMGPIEQERNRFIHSSWAIKPGGGYYGRRKFTRGSAEAKVEEVTADEMEIFAATIRALAKELESFIEIPRESA